MMLTADMLIDTWNAFAERHGLESGATEDAHGLRALTMKGRLEDRPVTLSYDRITEGVLEAPPMGVLTEDATVDVGLVPDVTTYVLRASGPCAPQKAGVVRVTRDPTPLFRRVAAWFGGGDPTVGDKDFDERYLIDAHDDALTHEVLTSGLRSAIQAAQGMDVEFKYTDGLAEVRLHLVEDGELALSAVTAVLKAAAG